MSLAAGLAVFAAGALLAPSAQARAAEAAAAGSKALSWSPQAVAELEAALHDAPRHGFSGRRFLDLLSDAGPDERNARLTRAALGFAEALATGVVDPADLFDIYTLEGPRHDLGTELDAALRDNRLRAWLDSLAPQDDEYRRLSEAYLQELRRAQADPGGRIEDGPLIRPGARDPRVVDVRRRLVDEGFGATIGPQSGEAYDQGLVDALRAFQAARGIRVDGVIGPDTLEQLNRGPRERAAQLAVNLERRRWLSRSPPSTRIDVNIAAARLDYIRNGEPAWSTRVVVGSPGHETPQLEEQFSQLVVNPPWYVPGSIAQEEILPRGPAYLRRHDMYVQDGRVIQRPGPEAALGQVKFDMQNRYAIYLHDTPAKALFEAAARHRSHGCVRVEDAVAFARRLAEAHGQGARFDEQLASGETGVVELGAPTAVRLLYHSAYVSADGRVVFRPDAYGWDERVAAALGLPPGRKRAPIALAPAPLGP